MRVRKIAMLISAVAMLVGGLSGTANAQPSDPQIEAVPATTDDVPAPPPPPVTNDGVQLQGSWIGPYTYRNLNSGRCLDIRGASKDSGAQAVQYRCIAGRTSQMWYLWHTEGDGSIDFHLIANGNSGKCLEPIPSATRGAPLLQYNCYLGLDNQVWYNTSTYPNVQVNDASHYCMEVQGGSLADLTKIVQWDCHRRAHQTWLRYNA